MFAFFISKEFIMLDFVRNNKKAMLILLVVLIIPSFVVLGVNFNFSNPGANELAHVGKNTIIYDQLDNRMKLIRNNNPDVSQQEFNTPEFKMQVLRAMIEELLWSTGAHENRLVVTDQALLQALMSLPFSREYLDENGRINPDQYKQAVLNRGYQVNVFENQILRPELMVERMKLPATYGFTSRVDVEQYMKFIESRYVLRQRVLNFQEYVDGITVTSEELQKNYEDYKKFFVEPASVDIEYVVFDLATLGNKLSKEELKSYYEQNKASFDIQQQRKISHILIKGDDAKQKAEELLLKLRADPTQFAELAKEYSMDVTSSNGGDLGYISEGMLAPLDHVAFSLNAIGDISEVIESPYGYHIVMLTDIQGAGSSFEDVFPLIELELRKRAAASLSADAIQKFSESVSAENNNFNEVAQEFGIQIQQAHNITQQPQVNTQGILNNTDFLNVIFNPEILASSKNSSPVKVGPTQIASVRVISQQPERVKTLAEVETQLKDMIIQQKAIAQAQIEAQKILEQWGKSPEEANDAEEVSFTQEEVMQWFAGVRDQQVDPNVMKMLQEIFAVADKVFQYSPASSMPDSFMVELPSQGYIVAQLQRIEVPETFDDERITQRAIGLGEVITDSQRGAMIRNMEKVYDAGIYPDTMGRLSIN